MVALTYLDLYRILSKSGIHIREVPQLPYPACVLAKEGKYHIKIMEGHTDTEKLTLLKHEMHHILRGDLKRKEEEVDYHLLNIAADSQINELLDKDIVNKLRLITYSGTIYPMYPTELPKNHLPGWKLVYDVLERNAPELPEGGLDELIPGDINERDHTKVVLRVRENAREKLSPEEYDKLMEGCGAGIDRPRRGSRSYSVPPPTPVQLAIKAIKHSTRGTMRERKRSYSRPGRIPGLRGSTLPYTINVLLAMDVSGSCTAYEHDFISIARYCESKYQTTVAVFADDIAPWKGVTSGSYPEVGGGTQFTPVMRYANRHGVDVLLMLTDGMPGDSYTPPLDIPVIWMCPGDHTPPHYREGFDTLVPVTTNAEV